MKKILLFLLVFSFSAGSASATLIDRSTADDYNYLMVTADNTGEERIAAIGSKFSEAGIFDDQLSSIKIIDIKEDGEWMESSSWESSDIMNFYPEVSGTHNVVLSGDYLAITAKNASTSKRSIIAFKIKGNKLNMVYQRNTWELSRLGYFGLYDNILIYQGVDGDPNTSSSKNKISYVDLAGDVDNIITVNKNDNKSYLSPAIYEREIAYVMDNAIYIFDLDTSGSRKVVDIKGSFNDHLNYFGKQIVYESFNNSKKNLVIVNLDNGEEKIFFDYNEKDNIDFLTMNEEYIGFAMRMGASYNRDRIYIYDVSNDYIYIPSSDIFDFGFPAFSNQVLIWTDNKSGKFMYNYAYLDKLAMDSDLIYHNNLFPITYNAYNKYRGKILLQVEQNGEAWYVDPKPNDMKSMYIDELSYRNLPRENISFLGRPQEAFNVMRAYGMGITNQDLSEIPIGLSEVQGVDSDQDGLVDTLEDAIGTNSSREDSDSDSYSDKEEVLSGNNPLGEGKMPVRDAMASNSLGTIYLQVKNNGEAWYLNPADSKRYFLGRPEDAFNIMKTLGKGISNKDFLQLFP